MIYFVFAFTIRLKELLSSCLKETVHKAWFPGVGKVQSKINFLVFIYLFFKFFCVVTVPILINRKHVIILYWEIYRPFFEMRLF